ncbi:hypothetical protein BT96DRAFT_868700 [Gymnopus androsaceus JB14]|uniref:Oxidase ustYa n=1 Tax=Gymnopus androsaceus JB14 TaxID=1447944 RepID=A0A6A4GGN8_9AGAR|nr:hypothetical protein BT96DRAFT_868700 [Gymnopus androsaceus JB14]
MKLLSVDWSITILCAITNISILTMRAIFPQFLRQCYGTASMRTDEHHYSYVGDDYPEYLPLPTMLQTTNTVFEVKNSLPISGPNAATHWQSIYPPGYGFVRLGTESRLLCVAMFHELHCIEKMRIFLDDPTNREVGFLHQQHCMNYLRQIFLCKADMTLEPLLNGDIDRRNLVMKSGMDIERSCVNWKDIYDAVGDNYLNWKENWNISSPFTTSL